LILARLGDYIREECNPLGSSQEQGLRLIGVSNEHGLHASSREASDDLSRYQRIEKNWFAYNPMRVNVGSIGLADDEMKTGYTSPDYTVFSCRQGIDPHYLLLFLKSDYGLEAIGRNCSGAVRKRLYYSGLSEIELPVPSLTEQRAVVLRIKRINETIRTIREQNSDRHELPQIKQAMLRDAVQGKLTADWRAAHPNVEPANTLLQRIQAEKLRLISAKKLRAEKPPPKIITAEIPFGIPKGWTWCRMQEVGFFQRGKSRARPRNDPRLFNGGKIPFVQTGDVARSKRTGFRIETCTSYYNEMGLAQSRLWPQGTMCITIAANIAETGFLTFPACVPDSVVAFTPAVVGKTPEFLRMFIELTRTAIQKFAPATAQKNINLEIIGELMLPLPPLSEQAAIVEKVETLMAICGTLEAEIEKSRVDAAHLLQVILKDAFAPRPKSPAVFVRTPELAEDLAP
jgi:restriction endonuclease S subunit